MLTRKERLYQAWKRLRLLRRTRGHAEPLYLIGEQRSGTNMVHRILNRHPLTECYYESDDEAYDNYELRENAVIRALVQRSRADCVVFKPLCDIHRIHELLELVPGGKAVWIYRHYCDVINSAIDIC